MFRAIRWILASCATVALAGCGGGGNDGAGDTGAVVTVPAPAATAAAPVVPPVAAVPAATVATTPACVAGNWSVAAAPEMPGVHLETAHLALRWPDGLVGEVAGRAAAAALEHAWQVYTETVRFPAPDCADTAKRKVNVHVYAGGGLSGGVSAGGLPSMWIGADSIGDRFGLAHELAHAMQGGTGGLRNSPFAGWMWESHANFMATQLPEYRGLAHCSEVLVNHPHLYYGSTRNRYCNFQFWDYLKNRFGYAAVNDIWSSAPRDGDPRQTTTDPFSVLMANRGWDQAALNDVFADWAMHNVNWDYVDPDGTDRGPGLRAAYGSNDDTGGDRVMRVTRLEAIDTAARRFAVPFAWAPQRWGYNLVKLVPDAGATRVAVTFRGVTQDAPAVAGLPGLADEPVTLAGPASGWRYGIVAIDGAGRSHYSAIGRDSDGRIELALPADTRSAWLVVMGAPTRMQQVRWDQPWYSVYRYPWMIEVAGAQPGGYEPGAAPPVAGARRHANGGGWVAPGASVAASAWVGPYARVLGGTVADRARIEDHATVRGGRVEGDAVVAAMTVVDGDTALRDRARAATVFRALGGFEGGIVLSGTAQVIGDVEQRGASAAAGVFYGFVDSGRTTDPRYGAALAAPVAEVTAVPWYRWRP